VKEAILNVLLSKQIARLFAYLEKTFLSPHDPL